jgi:hypothetical protein
MSYADILLVASAFRRKSAHSIRREPDATGDIGSYFFAMTMLPLKVESSRIALPSPYVPLSERRLRSG